MSYHSHSSSVHGSVRDHVEECLRYELKGTTKEISELRDMFTRFM